MLVLSRKSKERIVIGDNVVITIVEVRRGRVRVGISCPNEIPIRREELPQKNGAGSATAPHKQAVVAVGG